jgi:predicted ATP-grasp superfamily ATP-dependent carboligase
MVSRNHFRLEERYRLTTSPWEFYLPAVDKRCLHRHAKAVGVDAPRTITPRSRADVERLDILFPAILKPAYRIEHNAFTDDKAWRVDDRASMLAAYDRASQLVDAPLVMIQELIPGDGEQQLAFGAVCDEGDVRAWVTARRTRQYPADFGRASTFVETIDCPEVAEAAKTLLAALKLSGLVEVEFKRDPRDGRYKLLDVNARAWGWHSIGAAAGTDFAYLAWRIAQGEPVEFTEGRSGVRWVRLTIDAPVTVKALAAHPSSWSKYLRSLRAPIEGPIAARDDLAPGLIDMPLLGMRVAVRTRRRAAAAFRRRTA